MYIKFKKDCDDITVGRAYPVEDMVVNESIVKYVFRSDSGFKSCVESTTENDLFEVVIL